jgi:hypothetical protein
MPHLILTKLPQDRNKKFSSFGRWSLRKVEVIFPKVTGSKLQSSG